MSVSQERINELYSAEVVTSDDESLGGVGHVYLDDHSGEPSWITVKTGWFGTRQSLVPLDGAELTAEGTVRVVPTKEVIKEAPNLEAEAHLSAEEQDKLFRYYESAGVDVSRYGDRSTPSGGRSHHQEDGMQTDSTAGHGEGTRGQDPQRDAAVADVVAHQGVHAEGHPTSTGSGRDEERDPAVGSERTDSDRTDSDQTDEEILGEDDLSDDRMIGDDAERRRADPEGSGRVGLRRHENP